MEETKQPNPGLMFLQKWAVNLISLLIAAQMVGGIRFESHLALGVASFLLTLLYDFVRPILYILTLPLMLLTLTLFRFVINAILVILVGGLVIGFEVNGFGAAFWGALIVSICSSLLTGLTGTKEREYEFQRKMRERRENRASSQARDPNPARPPRDDDDGSGPVIDV